MARPRSDRSDADRYAAKREAAAAEQRRLSAEARDIGPVPDIASVRRRARCRSSLRLFCETYNPDAFTLDWSADHLRAMARIEEAATGGALYALAMARGSGKTTVCRMAALWALSYGICRYVFLINATDTKAADTLESLRIMMRFGRQYGEDFPEISFPAQRLEGITRRAAGQTSGGNPTLIEWSDDRVVCPTVLPPANWPKSWPLRADGMVPTAGSAISASGLTGEGIRGSLLTLSSGEMIRPDFVLLDDPQTPESARSRTQNATRESLVSADVLGMAGPGKTISAVMPCTVIAPGDFIDRILDRDKHPLWRGERSGMMRSMPKNLAAWDRYFEVYRMCALKEPPDFDEADEYYVVHRAELDDGAEASWPARKLETEVSAVQHAMHLYFRDPRAFASEYQNDPLPPDLDQIDDLDADAIVRRLSGVPRGVVPPECTRLTAFVDVGESAHYWCVCGWTEAFGGAVVDYGTTPKQNRSYFAARDARPSLADQFPRHDVTARVYAGLKAAADDILGRAYPRAGGGEARVGLCMVDTGHLPDTVYSFCREHPLAALLMPGKGYGIGAGASPMAQWAVKPGEKVGWNWRKSPTTGGGRGTHVIYDTNHWKTFAAQRLSAPMGGAGCLTLFGDKANDHRLFADHMVAEYRVRTAGRGRELDEWKMRPEKPDNHWWDCLVGATVAASVLGVAWSAAGALGEPVAPRPARAKVKLSELYRQKHGGK